MQKISEYEQYAIECRKTAAEMNDPAHKKQMEVMAELWEVFALAVNQSKPIEGAHGDQF
jgi:hypothetical protein